MDGRLFLYRLREGLTQEEAAKYIGVHRISWVRWESGASAPSLPYLIQLADWANAPIRKVIALFPSAAEKIEPLSPKPEKKSRRAATRWAANGGWAAFQAIRKDGVRHVGVEGNPECPAPWTDTDAIDNADPTCSACLALFDPSVQKPGTREYRHSVARAALLDGATRNQAAARSGMTYNAVCRLANRLFPETEQASA